MKKAFIISTVITTVLFSLISMAQNTSTAYRKIGPVYIVHNPGQSSAVISVAEYKNATDDSWHYFLQLNALKDNSELKRKEIAVKHETPLEFEQVIGKLGDVFFVIADSLVGYDVHTLEPVVTTSTLTEANPLVKLSKLPNTYLLDEGAMVMYITDDNGSGHKLYPGSQILKPDDGHNEQARKITATNLLPSINCMIAIIQSMRSLALIRVITCYTFWVVKKKQAVY
ncbi:MAG: hypothetical protein QM737_09525 [Ferruginibacter sp.]